MKLQPGDIIFYEKPTIKTIFSFYKFDNFHYYQYNQFYNMYNADFNVIYDIENYSKFKLEEFYQKYPEMTKEAFLKLYEKTDKSNLYWSDCTELSNIWLKRLPNFDIYTQINKYNL